MSTATARFLNNLVKEGYFNPKVPEKSYSMELDVEMLTDAFRHAVRTQGLTVEDLTVMVSEAFANIQHEAEEARAKQISALDNEEQILLSKLEKLRIKKEELV